MPRVFSDISANDPLRENPSHAFERFPDRRGIVDQSNADEIRARIGSVTAGLGQKATWYDLDAHTFP